MSVSPTSNHCALCSVQCNSVTDLQQHQAGQKHQKRLLRSASASASASTALTTTAAAAASPPSSVMTRSFTNSAACDAPTAVQLQRQTKRKHQKRAEAGLQEKQLLERQLCVLSDEGNAAAKLVLPSFRQQVREQVGHAYIDAWTEDSLQRPRLCAFIARLFLAGWMPFAAVRSVLTERITSTSDAASVACALQMFRVLSPSPQDPDAQVRPETAPHHKELQRLFLTLLRCPAAVKLDSHNAAAATPTASAAAATSATKPTAAAATDAWESSQAALLHEMRQLWGKH